jgi:hypothetical protein
MNELHGTAYALAIIKRFGKFLLFFRINGKTIYNYHTYWD